MPRLLEKIPLLRTQIALHKPACVLVYTPWIRTQVRGVVGWPAYALLAGQSSLRGVDGQSKAALTPTAQSEKAAGTTHCGMKSGV
jgi:hypothetical protein